MIKQSVVESGTRWLADWWAFVDKPRWWVRLESLLVDKGKDGFPARHGSVGCWIWRCYWGLSSNGTENLCKLLSPAVMHSAVQYSPASWSKTWTLFPVGKQVFSDRCFYCQRFDLKPDGFCVENYVGLWHCTKSLFWRFSVRVSRLYARFFRWQPANKSFAAWGLTVTSMCLAVTTSHFRKRLFVASSDHW